MMRYNEEKKALVKINEDTDMGLIKMKVPEGTTHVYSKTGQRVPVKDGHIFVNHSEALHFLGLGFEPEGEEEVVVEDGLVSDGNGAVEAEDNDNEPAQDE